MKRNIKQLCVVGCIVIYWLWMIQKVLVVILSGQPRRHLLTTGWSIFVSQKNLVSGDAVLFLRWVFISMHMSVFK